VELVAPAQTFWWESVMADQKQSIILVVDEEPQILRLVRLILSREGWRVVCARSIREGIRLCRRAPGRVALALVDALTAEAHGPDWLDGLRAESEDLKVVLMSAGALPDQPAPCGFVAKPFSPDVLCETVRRALGRRVKSFPPVTEQPPVGSRKK
jgi:DNA-binding NtrC family response regulator